MALAARICRKIRGLLSFGWLWRPGTGIWRGSEATFKGRGYPHGVREGQRGPNGVREGHGYPHDVSLHVWEQNLCIFTLFSLSGEQHLCIFTLFSLSGAQNLCVYAVFSLSGEQHPHGVREGHGYPHGVLNN